MNAKEIIALIQHSQKKTPVKVFLKSKRELAFTNCQVFGSKEGYCIFGDYKDVKKEVEKYREDIIDFIIENDSRNSAIPLLDTKELHARIEPGAIIRDKVEIGDNAVIMMGAIINIGAVIGAGTMIDMGAILGGRAIVGNNCHIGAGTVLAGVIEPESATPVVIEDNVLIGANAVVIEGIRIGKGSVVAAGAVVISDVPENTVVAGVPAKIIKKIDEKTISKTELIESLRNI